MYKLAVIRNQDTPCPFGLLITNGCQNAGDSVDDMRLIDDDDDNIDEIIQHNIKVFLKNPYPAKCKYAAHLFKNKPSIVDCDFGDTAAGITPKTPYLGSPYYTQIQNGLGIGGLLNYPMTHDDIGQGYRNMYYGITNWANDNFKTLLRRALIDTLKVLKS